MPVYKYTLIESGTTWTVPSDLDTAISIGVNGWGAGGGGGRGNSTGSISGSGGGGGAWSYSAVSLSGFTPGSSIAYVSIGAAGTGSTTNNTAGGTGGDTWFNKTSNAAPSVTTDGVLAKGGGGGGVATTVGAGGAAASGVGDSKGDGGAGGGGNFSVGGGGGGGGSAARSVSGGLGGGTGRAANDGGGGGGGGVNGVGSNATNINGAAGGINEDNQSAGANTAGTKGGGGGGGTGINFTGTANAGGGGGAGTAYFVHSSSVNRGAGGGGGGGGGSNNAGSIGGAGGAGGNYGGGGGGGGGAATTGNGGNGAQGGILILYSKSRVVSIGDLQTIFGGSNPANLGEYYAGGAYVPDGATVGTSLSTYVPSTGTLAMSNFTATIANSPRFVTVGSRVNTTYYGGYLNTDYGFVNGVFGSVNSTAVVSWLVAIDTFYGLPGYHSGGFIGAYWTTPDNVLTLNMSGGNIGVATDRVSIGKSTFTGGTNSYNAPSNTFTRTWSTSTNPFVADNNRSRLRIWNSSYPDDSGTNT